MSRMLFSDVVIPDLSACAQVVDEVRAARPLVQCLTNSVVSQFTANVALAHGISPAMVDIEGEAGLFAQLVDGLLVNLGTPHPSQRAAMREAVRSAQSSGTPWVLDPVSVGALPVRTELARELLLSRPTAIRGNSSEILALAGDQQGGRGTDSTARVEQAIESARKLSREYGSVVCVSGPSDAIVYGDEVVWVEGGSEYLTQVTGGGCALGAVVAAYVGVHRADPFAAAIAAHGAYGMAAGWAQYGAEGPGSFAVAFLDGLSQVDSASFASEVRIR